MVSTSDCPHCEGRGWVNVPGRAVRRCECWTSPPLATLLANSGMRPAEIAAAMEPWDERYSLRPNFVESWAVGKAVAPQSEPWAIVLLSAREIDAQGDPVGAGAPGRGKTKAAALAMRSWCETKRMPGLWVNVPEALDDAMDERARFHVPLAEIEERIIGAKGLVVLDDAGAERGNEARASAFSAWIYRRHRNLAPTLITTNAADLEALGDGRIASRLGEADVRRLLGATDYREIKAAAS